VNNLPEFDRLIVLNNVKRVWIAYLGDYNGGYSFFEFNGSISVENGKLYNYERNKKRILVDINYELTWHYLPKTMDYGHIHGEET